MIDWLNPVFIYSFLRAKIYSSGLKARIKLQTAVVSVGNLQFGGSGKTPFVMYLLNRYQKYSIAVVSQSYKGLLRQPEQVDLTKPHFQKYYGDEPSLIQQKFPRVNVWCGPVKWEAAKAASDTEKYDLIIVDDGFTHHHLFRDLNILLLDGSRKIETYRLPPFGQLREALTACTRAHAVVITKVNSLVDREDIATMVKPLNERLSYARYVSGLNEIKPKENYFLFAGIGNFDFFYKNAKELNLSIHSFKSFENHAEYPALVQQQILEKLKNLELRGLTTTKDRIKLTLPELLARTDCLHVEVQLEKSMEQWLDDSILATISAKNR